MKWNHLPTDGGLYAQHPDLLDGFSYIFQERNKHDREEHEREKKKQEAERRKGGSARVAGRRR